MDVWTFLDRSNISTDNGNYKKWLDVSSSHFRFEPDSTQDIHKARQICRLAKDNFQESGRYLVHLSAPFYYQLDENVIPLFLTPVLLDWNQHLREISWRAINNHYFFHPNLHENLPSIELEGIKPWLETQNFLDKNRVAKLTPALYLDTHQRQYVRADIERIKKTKLSSTAIESLFHSDIRTRCIDSKPEFLSFTHSLPLDYSQAKAIDAARNNSCIISGPPGTGKSQTIVNLAIEEMIAGKKIAIVSQKKAALDVLVSRFKNLNLTNEILNLSGDIHNSLFYESLEKQLDSVFENKCEGTKSCYNDIYFKHCIRTLEDYFEAKKLTARNSTKDGKANIWNHDFSDKFYDLFYPHQSLLSLTPEMIISEFNTFKIKLSASSELANLSIGFLAQMDNPLRHLSQYDYVALKSIARQKTVSKELKNIENKIKASLKIRPTANELEKLGESKLSYYLALLMEDSWWKKILNTKLDEIVAEARSLDKQWNDYKTWDKITSIKSALNYLRWEKDHKELVQHELEIKRNLFEGILAENRDYLYDKMNSKLQVWTYLRDYIRQHDTLNFVQWIDIAKGAKKFCEINENFKSILAKELLDYNLISDGLVNKLEWQQLCGMKFQNIEEWNQFRHKEDNTRRDFPVLKNYNAREIVQMIQFIRKNYSHYSNSNFQNANEKFKMERSQEISQLLKARKPEWKSKKLKWKESIKYIEKNWSKRGNKPSIYQVIRSLDIDFLLCIKPLVIANMDNLSHYIDLKSELFDTLIIDEASQAELLDSIPALVRAKKLVVVGDSQQLTPTRFFKVQSKGNMESESLLERAEEKLVSTQLNHHYRSQFRELIQFSNQYFYNNSLYLPQKNGKAIQRIYLENGVYEQRKNELEALTVVELLKKKLDYNGSIGIVAFSIQQKETILRLIDNEIDSNEEFQAKMHYWEQMNEPIFVKSIEQVQGDERDTIIISTGYARNSQGKLYYFFGPLLTQRGENRLNVLMSRAREAIVFITSLQSADIHIHTSSSRGLKIFRDLLYYVELPAPSRSYRNTKALNFWEHIFKKSKS